MLIDNAFKQLCKNGSNNWDYKWLLRERGYKPELFSLFGRTFIMYYFNDSYELVYPNHINYVAEDDELRKRIENSKSGERIEVTERQFELLKKAPSPLLEKFKQNEQNIDKPLNKLLYEQKIMNELNKKEQNDC